MSNNDLINLDGMVYISGKITGTDDFMERFATAAERLNSAGYVVCNPASLNATMPSSTSWEGYMGESLRMLSHCAAIYMLRGWEESRGARVELSVALQMGKRVMFEDAPAVPQEMSAIEYLRTMRSICEDGRNCGKCPLSYNNNGAGINCQDYAAHYPEKAVAAVQKWALEHPEERSEEA